MSIQNPIRVLLAGCGNMGALHGKAYYDLEGFEVAGIVGRNDDRNKAVASDLGNPPVFNDFEKGLESVRPEAVCICTYPDTHAEFAIKAMEAGADVFLEKPVAENLEDARRVFEVAERTGRKLVIGYILHQHPHYKKFIEEGRTLGKPLVMRMNFNQQSEGAFWKTHKNILDSMTPIVDCGVHYVDVMCSITGSRPVSVYSMGARVSHEKDFVHDNYGHMQIRFEDGSIGWYEAGWGPMMSRQADFVKDVVGPGGSLSFAKSKTLKSVTHPDKMQTVLLRHYSDLDKDGNMGRDDQEIVIDEDPSVPTLCRKEQEFFLAAIRGNENVSDNHKSAMDSLRLVLAADESARTGKVVEL